MPQARRAEREPAAPATAPIAPPKSRLGALVLIAVVVALVVGVILAYLR